MEFLPTDLNDEQRTRIEKQADDELNRFRGRLDRFKPATAEGQGELDKIREIASRYERDAIHRKIVPLAREKKFEEANKLTLEGDRMVAEMRTLLRSLEDRNSNLYSKGVKEVNDEQAELLNTIIVIAVGGCILGLLAAFTTIVVGITNPLMRLISTMQALAAGRADKEIEGTARKDEIGMMAQTVSVFPRERPRRRPPRGRDAPRARHGEGAPEPHRRADHAFPRQHRRNPPDPRQPARHSAELVLHARPHRRGSLAGRECRRQRHAQDRARTWRMSPMPPAN